MSFIQDAIDDLDENRALNEIRRLIQGGQDPDIVTAEIRRGLNIVAERFNSSEYALIELEMADQLFQECMNVLESLTGKRYAKNPRGIEKRSRISNIIHQGRVD